MHEQAPWVSVDEVGKCTSGFKVGCFWKFKRDDVDAWVRDGGAASGADEDLLKEKPDHE